MSGRRYPLSDADRRHNARLKALVEKDLRRYLGIPKRPRLTIHTIRCYEAAVRTGKLVLQVFQESERVDRQARRRVERGRVKSPAKRRRKFR